MLATAPPQYSDDDQSSPGEEEDLEEAAAHYHDEEGDPVGVCAVQFNRDLNFGSKNKKQLPKSRLSKRL